MSSATAGKGRAARARSLLAENVRLKPGNAGERRLSKALPLVLQALPHLLSLSDTRRLSLLAPLARLVTL